MGYTSSSGQEQPGRVDNVLSTLKEFNGREMFKDVSIGHSIPSKMFVNPFFFEGGDGDGTEISKIK